MLPSLMRSFIHSTNVGCPLCVSVFGLFWKGGPVAGEMAYAGTEGERAPSRGHAECSVQGRRERMK